MLLAVSETLKKFLQANVAPPMPQVETEEWVHIAELNADSVAGRQGRLVVFMYAVESDPFVVRQGGGSGGTFADPPLSLSLHYLMTFLSSSHETDQRVLGQVLQAFWTEPIIQPRNYLSESDYARYTEQREVADRIRVLLEMPDLDKVSHLWNAMRTGQRLALYYSVSVASIPPGVRRADSGVATSKPPKAEPMPR